MKILILGHKGMLGHMVKKYMESVGFQIETFIERWPSFEFINQVKNSKSTFLINCIGSIPQKKPNWEQYKSVNILLPLFLSKNFKGKIIHPTTDSEFSGNLSIGSFYSKTDTKDAMDDYGISKSHTSYLLSSQNNVKQIRASIIGPELSSKVSLMEWFFKQDKSLNGYTNHYWNGITTLEWSEHCVNLVNNWNQFESVTQLGVDPITKYELLKLINEIYGSNKIVNPVEEKFSNKCLLSDYKISSLNKQLEKLKQYNS